MARTRSMIGWMLVVCLVSGCVLGPRAPQPSPIPLDTLLIDASVYPPGWMQLRTSKDKEYSWDEEDNKMAEFAVSQDAMISTHEILWYRSTSDAQQGYERLLNYNASHHNFTQTKQLTYVHAHAASINCATVASTPTYICIAVARYGTYVSILSAYIGPGGLDDAEFERILEAIDQRLAGVVNDT